jgi:DNA (cytosine-5)-methyltransferase 1
MPEFTLPDIPGPATLVSLFDGIAGFPLAFSRTGVPTVVTVEIDKPAAGVAADHFPDAVAFADIREVTGADLLAAGFDPRTGRISAGFPCQDLSLAGRRMGLGGARSGLFFEIMRLVDEIFQLTGVRCRWLVLENVPGLLSSVCPCPGGDACGTGCTDSHTVRGGACGPGRCVEIHGGAMGAVLGALAERGYGYAYRVLDAQHFGVPQRRRRVVIVANSRDWDAPAQVLLEPQGRNGDPAPGRAQAARTARVLAGSAAVGGVGRSAPTLQGGGRRGYRVDAEMAAGGGLIPTHEVSGALTANMAGAGSGVDENTAADGHLVVNALTRNGITGTDDNTAQGGHLLATTLTARDGKGPDSDATSTLIPFDQAQTTSAHNRSRPEPGDPAPTLASGGRSAVAFQGHGGNVGPMGTLRAGEGTVQSGVPFTVLGEVAHALTAAGADASEDGTGRGTPVIAFGHTNGMDEQASDHVTPTIRAGSGGGAVMQDGWQGGSAQDQVVTPEGVSPTLAHSSNAHGGHHQPKVMIAPDAYTPADLVRLTAVRRLTPVECERLQGYPDGWTATSNGRPQADSARYRQLGNSVAEPVFEWVALGINEYDEAKEHTGR